MKRLIYFNLFLLIVVGLSAQDITISFQPKVAGTQIDSMWVTNQSTSQKIKLLASESLLLEIPTGIDIIRNNVENGWLAGEPHKTRGHV